jgi:hypothetical protein
MVKKKLSFAKSRKVGRPNKPVTKAKKNRLKWS